MLSVEVSFYSTKYLCRSQSFTSEQKKKLFKKEFQTLYLDFHSTHLELYNEPFNPIVKILADKVSFDIFSKDK